MARKIYTELRDKGRVVRGWLGVSIQPLTPDSRASSAPGAEGRARQRGRIRTAPPAKAGIQRGDILLEFDGKKLEGPGDLQRSVGLFSPDQNAKLKVWREQRRWRSR